MRVEGRDVPSLYFSFLKQFSQGGILAVGVACLAECTDFALYAFEMVKAGVNKP